MVVAALNSNNGCKDGVVDGIPSLSADVSSSPVLPRRTSARVKKLEAERALRRCAVKEEEEESSEESETRKVRKRVRKAKANPPKESPAEVVDDGNEGCDGQIVEVPDLGNNEVMAERTGAEISDLLKALMDFQMQSAKSDNAKAIETIRTFNKLYLYYAQEEEKRVGASKQIKAQASEKMKAPKDDPNDTKGPHLAEMSKKRKTPEDDTKIRQKRPDLKAMSKIIQTNAVLHPKKKLGAFPGIDPGYQFLSRAEMVVIGFHGHHVSGIDYIGKAASKDFAQYKLPLAVAVVLSGQYEDDLDNSEDLVYTGQGGNDLLGNKRQVQGQVMERGNLALKNSIEEGTPVRVVRGHDSRDSYARKVYTYDGLYKVTKYWAEEGISGHTVYKFQLKRLEGQPPLTTSQVYYTRGRIPQSLSEIRGLVCEDISGGLESIPIPATNLFDDPPVPPTGYTYQTKIKVAKSVTLPGNASGCSCKGVCNDSRKCACARLNGSDFPYVHLHGGRLIEPRAVVFECGPNCGCGPECVNRTSQQGLRYRLEVFKTAKKGWGVRSWDYIPSGAPVCEYIGVVMKAEDVKADWDDTYIFDMDCLQTMKGLDGRERRMKDVAVPSSSEKIDDSSVPEYCIDGGSWGNVSRFINHSCQPNLFVQCVLSSHHDVKLARIVLFAADNIPPLKELSYDYGYAVDTVLGEDGKPRQMACFCGEADCRKRLL